MHINDIYGSSEWLRAADLQGRKVKVRIIDWDTVELKRPDRNVTQIALTFAGKGKRLGLNITNARMVASMLGDDPDQWLQQDIVLYPSKTPNASGQIVDCIRIEYHEPEPVAKPVRPARPAPTAPVQDERNPPPSDDVPF